MAYTTYEYNSSGLESKESTYDLSGHLSHYATSEYNSSGLMTKFSLYGATGTLTSHTTFEYNSSGLETKESIYDSSGHLEDYGTFEYNSSGLMIKFSNYDSSGSLSDYTIFEYTNFTPTPTQGCTATLNGNLLLHVPYLSYNNGAMTLSADLVYYPNPTYPTLIPFKLSNYAILNNPSFSCAASTLSSSLTIHISDVLFPDGVTHIWVDLTYNPALSTSVNFYWVVSNYGAVSN